MSATSLSRYFPGCGARAADSKTLVGMTMCFFSCTSRSKASFSRLPFVHVYVCECDASVMRTITPNHPASQPTQYIYKPLKTTQTTHNNARERRQVALLLHRLLVHAEVDAERGAVRPAGLVHLDLPHELSPVGLYGVRAWDGWWVY